MEYDKDNVDDMLLALITLTMFDDHGVRRTWKGYDFEHMNRLHEKGYIEDPRGKNKSVRMTEAGVKRSEELFRQVFGLAEAD